MVLVENSSGVIDGPAAVPGYAGLWCASLDEDLAEKLIERTVNLQDEELREMTRDLDRFSSRDRLEGWRGDRQMLCLIDSRRSLLGATWIGSKPMPERDDYVQAGLHRHGPTHTWAIRLYGSARGQGLAVAFSEHAFDLFANGEGQLPLWVEIKTGNRAARALGPRLGFLQMTSERGGSVICVRPDRRGFGGPMENGGRTSPLSRA